MSDPRPRPDRVAFQDQVEAGLGAVAGMVGSYYRDLRTSGLPDELCFRLVEHVHAIALAGHGESEGGEVSDEDVVYGAIAPFAEAVPYHRGRREDGCPVCGAIGQAPCVIDEES